MLKDALAGLPTRPVLYISTIVLVLGLGYHFLSSYRDCRGHAELREALRTAIQASADAETPLRLSAITDFPWDRAEILVNYKPGGSSTDCPFQWDWSRDMREELIDADLLTVVVFLRDGRLVDYLEYRRDWADFADVKNPYTPGTAVFRVTPSPTMPGAYFLEPGS
jgi:hypothetical protein